MPFFLPFPLASTLEIVGERVPGDSNVLSCSGRLRTVLFEGSSLSCRFLYLPRVISHQLEEIEKGLMREILFHSSNDWTLEKRWARSFRVSSVFELNYASYLSNWADSLFWDLTGSWELHHSQGLDVDHMFDRRLPRTSIVTKCGVSKFIQGLR